MECARSALALQASVLLSVTLAEALRSRSDCDGDRGTKAWDLQCAVHFVIRYGKTWISQMVPSPWESFCVCVGDIMSDGQWAMPNIMLDQSLIIKHDVGQHVSDRNDCNGFHCNDSHSPRRKDWWQLDCISYLIKSCDAKREIWVAEDNFGDVIPLIRRSRTCLRLPLR